MGILSADMKRVVGEQRLGFVATVCPDGTPNLSPKGTTAVWDDDHLVFANIRSPGTLANLRPNANVEVNVVDPFVRKGYRFKGVARVLESGTLYDQVRWERYFRFLSGVPQQGATSAVSASRASPRLAATASTTASASLARAAAPPSSP